MFLQGLVNWFRRKRGENERTIFRYSDGRSNRAIDPMTAYRLLATHPTFIWRDHPRRLERDQEALQITLQAVRDTFGVSPLSTDGRSGLSEEETLGLLLKFSVYLETVKKNGNHLLILPPPTARTSSPKISSPITKSDSVSGSTSPEQKPVEVEASPQVFSPPSDSQP